MHLKSIEITNFRKFRDKFNIITFVEPANKTDDESMIPSSTTLIVGKNNAGKTTVTNALEIAINEQSKVNGHDFNYSYLDEIFNKYLTSNFDVFPQMSFKLTFITDTKQASLVNAKKVIPIGNATHKTESKQSNAQFCLIVELQLSNKIKYIEDVKKLLDKYSSKDNDVKFRRFLELIGECKFDKLISSEDGFPRVINISSLIELKVISAAKNIHDNKLLSKAFNKIIKYKYQTNGSELDQVNSLIESNNDEITNNVKSTHQSVIRDVLKALVGNDSLGIELRADLTFDRLMDGLITYEHRDDKFLVPESQFGLGYANLISIVSEIIDYIERNPSGEKTNKVRLICIEEPEAFMHPQMQVNFIRHIGNAVKSIIGQGEKIRSQLLITTHSSHILNSKIHASGSLDNINYIYPKKHYCENISIKDSDISDKSGEKDEFYFIKKHIKYQVPELFFADGIIFVEGITEERLLNFYLERNSQLSKKLISVFRIDGAHAKVYEKLVRQLKIPSLIITDIDFKRSESELVKTLDDKTKIEIYPQMESISEDRVTTNKTLAHFFNTDKVSEYKSYYIKDNVMVVFQKDPVSFNIDGNIIKYYASSLEEALVLQNYGNKIFRDVIRETIEDKYYEIIPLGSDEYINLVHRSFEIQKKLAHKKTDFSNNIIYKLVVNDDSSSLPILPDYITVGLCWLSGEMGYHGLEL